MKDLPDPPPGRTGWPWTEESCRLDNVAADGEHWPRITVVTPSFNQGQFIEETIRSILLQGYPDVEYLILDGGSKDQSVEIIKKYSQWLSYWVSEPDAGQSDAINRGLKKANGVFATWINSDDMLCKNALLEHALRFGFDENTVYVGNCLCIDELGRVLSTHCGRVHSLEDLLQIGRVWRAGGHIIQPEVIFPRNLALSVGALNCDNHFTMDYELWGRFLLAGAKFKYTHIPFGVFREHAGQKTSDSPSITESLLKSAAELLKSAEYMPEEKKNEHGARLTRYKSMYDQDLWRASGRLAQSRLPHGLVTYLRNLRARSQ